MMYSWLSVALSVDAYYIYDHFFPQEKEIYVQPVENKIAMGKFAGSRNVAFGVTNILEEYLQEKEYDINEDSNLQLKVELLYMDVLKTQTNLSVFHKNSEAIVIRMKGSLIENNKVKKTAVVEESAEEISMSAVLIDEGGKFNNENLSSALKKACNSLINKLNI